MTFNLGGMCWECQSRRHLEHPKLLLHMWDGWAGGSERAKGGSGSLLGPEGGPMGLESGWNREDWEQLVDGLRLKKSLRELACFWEKGNRGASGLAGRTLFPCQSWGECSLREAPGLAQLAASFPAETLPRSPGGVRAPCHPPNPAGSGSVPSKQSDPSPHSGP